MIKSNRDGAKSKFSGNIFQLFFYVIYDDDVIMFCGVGYFVVVLCWLLHEQDF